MCRTVRRQSRNSVQSEMPGPMLRRGLPRRDRDRRGLRRGDPRDRLAPAPGLQWNIIEDDYHDWGNPWWIIHPKMLVQNIWLANQPKIFKEMGMAPLLKLVSYFVFSRGSRRSKVERPPLILCSLRQLALFWHFPISADSKIWKSVLAGETSDVKLF